MMIVPFPAGGGADAFARPLAAQFTKQTGKQLIIDNRGGAGGTVGASLAARAAPDGHNLFMGAVHHTIAPSIYSRLDYDLQGPGSDHAGRPRAAGGGGEPAAHLRRRISRNSSRW